MTIPWQDCLAELLGWLYHANHCGHVYEALTSDGRLFWKFLCIKGEAGPPGVLDLPDAVLRSLPSNTCRAGSRDRGTE